MPKGRLPVYLNACSHGLPAEKTVQAIAQQVLRGSGDMAEEASVREAARHACAALLHADPRKTGLGSGTTQIWTSVMGRVPMKRGRVVVASHEWGDHVRWLQRKLHSSDVTLDVVPEIDAFDLEAWAERMDEDVIAVCLPYVTSAEGLEYPVAGIAALDRPENALVVVDVAQALGRVDINPDALGCDVVVGTIRKWLRGPRQTALFWLSTRAKSVLGCDVKDIEPLDLNAGLLASTSSPNLKVIQDQVSWLEKLLRDGLESVPDLTLKSSQARGTVLLEVSQDLQSDLANRLRQNGIVAKWCKPKTEEPLVHSYDGSVLLRLSSHMYNTENDIIGAIKVISTNCS